MCFYVLKITIDQYLNFKNGSNDFVSFVYCPFRNYFHVGVNKNNPRHYDSQSEVQKEYKYEYIEVRVTPTSYHKVLFNRATLEECMKDLLAQEAHNL